MSDTNRPIEPDETAAEPVPVHRETYLDPETTNETDAAAPMERDVPPALVEPEEPVATPVSAVPTYESLATSDVAPATATYEPGSTTTAPEPVSATTAPEPVVVTPAVVTPAAVTTTQTGLPPVAPDRVVYVDSPQPPRKRGNRGVGVLLAIVATIVFAALYALIMAIVDNANGVTIDATLLSKPAFWVPVLFFGVGFIILVLIVNRASWWAHVIGSFLVALFVYFGSVVTLVIINGTLAQASDQAAATVRAVSFSPGAIAAALLAREVALWTGAAIAARGRRVKARNIEARAAFERDEEDAKARRDAQYAPQP